MQFQVPVENGLSVDTVANIYRLVALKDTYHGQHAERQAIAHASGGELLLIEVKP